MALLRGFKSIGKAKENLSVPFSLGVVESLAAFQSPPPYTLQKSAHLVLPGNTVCCEQNGGLIQQSALLENRLDLLQALREGGLGVDRGQAVVLHVRNVSRQLDTAPSSHTS